MIEQDQSRGEAGVGPGTVPPSSAPHWLARLALVMVAVAVVAWNWDNSQRVAIGTLDSLGSGSDLPFFEQGGALTAKRLTREQKFLLDGDLTRTNRHEQQRAIWEAHPENLVYLGNYVTSLASSRYAPSSLDLFRGEMAAARKLDPENARYDYLEAGLLLKASAEILSEKAGQDEQGKTKTEYSLEVRNREQLDEAMALLREGLGKPYWRRYTTDMLREQLAILGPPQRLLDLVHRTAIAAGTLLPDLAQLRTLARASRLYAELLIAEGKAAEAAPYLGAWEILGRQVTEDSFTLIDVLVANAIFKDAEQTIPPLYRQIGREAEAERAAARAALIAKPVTDWREQRDLARKPESQTAEQLEGEQLLQERAGVLASMLLPALGQWPAAEEYAPGRMLEYVVFTEFVIAVILGALLLTLFTSYLLALRWRVFRPAGEPPPPILMPDLVTVFRILLLGVILPLALFFVVTRYFPGSGHDYSVEVGLHKLAAEFGLLAVALGTLPILMTVAQVQRRCRALGVPMARWQARYLWWSLCFVGTLLLLIVWFLPPTSGQVVKTLAMVGLGFLAAALAVGILLGIGQGLGGQRQHGVFYGSVFRTLVPMLALTIIVLGVSTRPVLVRSEARYLERDTLMHDRDRVGFTRIENDLVEALRGAMLENVRAQAAEADR